MDERDELLVQMAKGLELLLTETARCHIDGTRDTVAMAFQSGAIIGARELFEKKARR